MREYLRLSHAMYISGKNAFGEIKCYFHFYETADFQHGCEKH